MAFMLEINEWIIVTKTNPKPMQNSSKTNHKLFLNQLKNSRGMDSKDIFLQSSFQEFW